MSRTERLLALIQALRRHRHPVSGRKLAEEMSVSLRTMYRDIQALIDQGVRIHGERGIGYVMRPGFLLPPLMFRDEEIEALVLGSRWVAQQTDESLARAAQDALTKIMTVLPENLKERMENSDLFPVPTAARVRDTIQAKILREAIRLERKLQIVYRDEQGRETTRVIWPVGSHSSNKSGCWWLGAKCERGSGISERIEFSPRLLLEKVCLVDDGCFCVNGAPRRASRIRAFDRYSADTNCHQVGVLFSQSPRAFREGQCKQVVQPGALISRSGRLFGHPSFLVRPRRRLP